MDERLTNSCRAKTGMLVLKDCGRPASGACASCGRPVCGKHKCETKKGTCCPECASMETTAAAIDETGKASATQPGQPGAKQKPSRKTAPPRQQGGAPPEDYDNLSAAERARLRRDWYDPYPFYVSAPYFFHYSDYNSFDYRDDSWSPTHSRTPGSGGDDGYDAAES